MNCKAIAAGGVLFVIEHRIDGAEHGASLSLLVDVTLRGESTSRLVTIWRADCVMNDPHEHVFRIDDEVVVYKEWFARSPVPIPGITKQEPATFDGSVEPCMGQILDVSDIVQKAGYEVTAFIDQTAINAVSGSIQRWMTLAQDAEAFANALKSE